MNQEKNTNERYNKRVTSLKCHFGVYFERLPMECKDYKIWTIGQEINESNTNAKWYDDIKVQVDRMQTSAEIETNGRRLSFNTLREKILMLLVVNINAQNVTLIVVSAIICKLYTFCNLHLSPHFSSQRRRRNEEFMNC